MEPRLKHTRTSTAPSAPDAPLTAQEDRNPTHEAAAYGAADLAGRAHAAGAAHEIAAEPFTRAEPLITRNEAGGAGFYAEAHHTASLNVDAHALKSEVHAERLGSTAFASADIRLSTGEEYNPKYYATAPESYRAGVDMLDDGTAKYHGQTIIVPSDQLDEVRSMHQAKIESAASPEERVALQSIKFDDHIDAHGVQSQPLTYDEARNGAQNMRQGELPTYAGEEFSLGESVADGALLAAAMAVASVAGPKLIDLAANVCRGKINRQTATESARQLFADPAIRSAMKAGAVRGAGAAALTGINLLDPLGAAFTVNLLVDVVQLAKRLRDGEISADEFGKHLGNKVKDRGLYSVLAAGAFALMGTAGLLVPIIVRRMVQDSQNRAMVIRQWEALGAEMQRELVQRLRTAALQERIHSLYQTAQARETANAEAAAALERKMRAVAQSLTRGHLIAPGAALRGIS